MAEAVVSFTIERLGDLLISEAKFLTGVSSQMADVQDQLKLLQSFLKDADAKGATNEGVRNWVAQIRDLAYRTEDVLETYAIEVSSKSGNKQIKEILKRFSCIFCECMTLHKIGLEIRDIDGKITSLATRRQAFGIEALLHDGEGVSSNMEEQVSLRTSYSHLIEKDFVGMEDEVKKLVSHLRNEERGCEVVSIWGMGGQGKTTLAKEIYNHVEVQSYFQRFAWVCVTQRFQRKKILQDILQELLQTEPEKQEVERMGDSELVGRLHKVQKERNCLVVLDDIWTLNAWESLKPAFPIGEETTGSKILLTTRIGRVANVGTRYALRSLSEKEAWDLFLKKAFPRRDGDDAPPENRINSKLEEIGRDMVEKCDGLPLAIAALGGLVKGKTELRQWEIFNKDIASNLNRGEGINDDEYGAVRKVLALSYDNLPYRLKHCFLYLGNFKEGEIFTQNLYTLWMAEGMVSSHDQAKGEMMMEVAERYLGELEQRSLVQLEPKIESFWLKFFSCRVHDLVRDMCLSKGKDEDFLAVIDYRDKDDPALVQGSNFSVDHMNKARRLAIYLHDDVDSLAPLTQHVIQQLRSLLFSNDYNLWPQEVPNLREFKLLRVLKLDCFKFRGNKLPEGIGKLLHLRYLSLLSCTLNELPSSIGNLRYLETLNLLVANSLIIPNVLWKMKRLKHLYLPEFILTTGADKLRFDGLSELEYLYGFDASVCENDLAKLTNLQVLVWSKVNSLQEFAGIINFINTDFIHHSLHSSLDIKLPQFGSEAALFRLTQVLGCQHLTSFRITGFVGILPKEYDHHSFSHSLTGIELNESTFEQDPMAVFEKLPNLRILRLQKISLVGKEMVCSANGFPQLRRLEFYQIPNLEKWVVDEGAMPFLSELQIWVCEKLEMLPDGLKFLTKLHKLRIGYMPEAFNDSVQVKGGVEGENFHKVRHVPLIQFED